MPAVTIPYSLLQMYVISVNNVWQSWSQAREERNERHVAASCALAGVTPRGKPLLSLYILLDRRHDELHQAGDRLVWRQLGWAGGEQAVLQHEEEDGADKELGGEVGVGRRD